jgi:hypothetical protein
MRAQRTAWGWSRASRSSDCTLRAHVKENRHLQVAQFLRLLTGAHSRSLTPRASGLFSGLRTCANGSTRWRRGTLAAPP